MPQKPYERDTDALRLSFHGMNIYVQPDKCPPGKFPYAQNVRAYFGDAATGRATQDSSLFTYPAAPHTIRRLNDSTPAGPAGGFVLTVGAGTNLYKNNVQVDSGFSGNPLSLIPFRPNQSVQPWMYVGDSLKMDKMRSDGLTYKMGVKEPQASPQVNSVAVPVLGTLGLVGPVTITFWGDSPHNGPIATYIWKNPSDSGWGPIWNSRAPAGVTTGNSLLLDFGGIGVSENPMQWITYVVFQGTVNTNGTDVTWVSGDDFSQLVAPEHIVIGTNVFQIQSVNSPTDITLTSPAGNQTNVNYYADPITGTTPVFSTPLEPEGFQDFNFILEANLYVPAAGTYTLSMLSKDDMIWGIGSTASGKATWPAASGGQTYSLAGQTKTAKNGYKLIPRFENHNSGGNNPSATIAVTFSAPGNYPLEIDYDYYFHTGRTLTVQSPGGVDIKPIPGNVIVNAQYRYVYRSSATGAKSNPSPESPVETIAVLQNTLVATPSTDPQVDKIDWYRLDSNLTNFTYVGTGPNDFTPFVDQLLDADIAGNPILEFDNFEPFPSIDLPKKGTVNVANGVATWVSGDQFNTRWLPGTIVVVGTLAYTFDKRPTDATHFTATITEILSGVETIVPLASGTNLTYEIAEPLLAAQPLPYMWGPTDNINFAYAVGDPLRPGTLYWCKGNNLDSAPDTNQEDVTSPSEPLQNGCIVNGMGMVFSTERAWIIIPNFFNALATVTGTIGSQWTLQESISNRGLYIPHCLAVDGGKTVFFRAKDGVYVSPGGQGSQSITDEDLYNLFPHEGEIPQPVTIGPYIVYPPDDTKPQAQKFSVANGYLYYDYLDTGGIPRTLVYGIQERGWIVDEYQFPTVVHALQEGANVNGTLTGNNDFSIRPLNKTGNETGCVILLVPSFNAGDTRAEKHFGDLYIEADSGA